MASCADYRASRGRNQPAGRSLGDYVCNPPWQNFLLDYSQSADTWPVSRESFCLPCVKHTHDFQSPVRHPQHDVKTKCLQPLYLTTPLTLHAGTDMKSVTNRLIFICTCCDTTSAHSHDPYEQRAGSSHQARGGVVGTSPKPSGVSNAPFKLGIIKKIILLLGGLRAEILHNND